MPTEPTWDSEKYAWMPFTLSLEENFNPEIPGFALGDDVRTAYLTKEQIIAEGWEYSASNGMRTWYKPSSNISANNELYGYPVHHISLQHDPSMKLVAIEMSFGGEPDTVFNGQALSINELRKIMQWTGITTK